MSEPDAEQARDMLAGDGEDVVEAWEERPAVVEAGVDDTTAPDPGRSGRERPPDEDVASGAGQPEPPD